MCLLQRRGTAASRASGSRHRLDQLTTQYRDQLRSDSRSKQPVPMHPKLLEPALCRHCRKVEHLESATLVMPDNGDQRVVQIDSSAPATQPDTGDHNVDDIESSAPATTNTGNHRVEDPGSSAPATCNTGDHRVDDPGSSSALATAPNTGDHRVEHLESSARPATSPNPGDHRVPVEAAAATPTPGPHRVSLEGRSCLACVKEIYEKTSNLQELPPAGSGGDTPLHHAARFRNLRMVYHLIRLLREGGVHHNRDVKAVAMRNDNEVTALHIAVSLGDLEIVELLLWVHPPLRKMTCFNISPIYLAVSLLRKDIAEALHDASSSSGISYSGPNRQNALHAAVLKWDDITQMLLTWNKELAKGKDDNGRTPLHFAVSVGEPRFNITIWWLRFPWGWRETDSVRQLLEADSSMAYEKDNEGLFPIHVAAMTYQWNCIDILLKRCPGCMDLRDNKGRTFLHIAVQNDAGFIVKCVCRRPELAPILNIQDKNGNTALHLAVDVQNLWMVCQLLKNREVLLNLRNTEGETALDVAEKRIPEGFFFNPDKLIYCTLQGAGAQYGCFLWDRLTGKSDSGRPTDLAEERTTPAEELEKEESAKLADSTRTLGIASVLTASVTFAAAITHVPGPGCSYENQQAGTGTDTAARSWNFEAFMIAIALACICASAATVGLMYSGMAMFTLRLRRRQFNKSLTLASCSVIFLMAAFSLGVYMVLAPVARFTAILVSAICPLVLIYKMAQGMLPNLVLIAGPLRARRGFLPCLLLVVRFIFFRMLLVLLPVAVFMLAWAENKYRFKIR